MKKSIILFGGLLFLTTQSCDVLDLSLIHI